jgi:RNA polymerase sigma factor for flagellar operon FliA
MGLVRSLAARVADQVGGVIEREELFASGREGLVQAAHRYDPERGVAFATFAYYRIRGAMFDALRKQGPLVLLGPRVAFEERADDYLEQRATQPAPTTAVEAGQRLKTMVADLATAYVMCSDRMEVHADATLADPCAVAEAREEIGLVREHLGRLPERERLLIMAMYFEGLSLTEAGERLGMSKGWASRLHARALATLREHVYGPGP